MTVNNPINRVEEWRWECLKMSYIAGGTVQDTGFDLPKYGEIDPWSMMVFVQTADATETLDVGILATESGGDEDGFLDGIDVASTGWVRPSFTIVDGTNTRYITPNTWGVLFFTGYAGADTSSGVDPAVPWVRPYIGDGTAKSLTYTVSSSDTFVGFLMFRWRQLPDLSSFLL